MVRDLGILCVILGACSLGCGKMLADKLRWHVRPDMIWFDRLFFRWSEETYTPEGQGQLRLARKFAGGGLALLALGGALLLLAP